MSSQPQRHAVYTSPSGVSSAGPYRGIPGVWIPPFPPLAADLIAHHNAPFPDEAAVEDAISAVLVEAGATVRVGDAAVAGDELLRRPDLRAAWSDDAYAPLIARGMLAAGVTAQLARTGSARLRWQRDRCAAGAALQLTVVRPRNRQEIEISVDGTAGRRVVGVLPLSDRGLLDPVPSATAKGAAAGSAMAVAHLVLAYVLAAVPGSTPDRAAMIDQARRAFPHPVV